MHLRGASFTSTLFHSHRYASLEVNTRLSTDTSATNSPGPLRSATKRSLPLPLETPGASWNADPSTQYARILLKSPTMRTGGEERVLMGLMEVHSRAVQFNNSW